MFYKRNGFIWCDLGRTPKARLALVVPPIAVKREREFIEQLLRKVEAEDALNRQRAKEQHERVASQRERLRNKVGRRPWVLFTFCRYMVAAECHNTPYTRETSNGVSME